MERATIRVVVAADYAKLNVASRIEAVMVALRHNLIPLAE